MGFLPNVFEYFVIETGREPPVRFVEEEIENNFLLNAGSIFTGAMINIVILCGVTIMSLLFPKIAKFQEIKIDLMYAFPLRLAIEGFLELNLAIMLQMRNLTDISISNIAASATAFLLLAS